MRRWLAAGVAAAMIAVLLLATAVGFRFVQPDPLPGGDPDPVIAVAPDDGGRPAAQVAGTLELRQGCLLVGGAVALFPDGTRWAGPDEVRFADGTRWRVGRQVRGAGGRVPVEALAGTDVGDRAAAAAAACAGDLGVDDAVLVRP